MPTDISLIKALMKTLVTVDGNPASRDVLATEAELRMGRPLTTQAVDDALVFCKQRGWAESRKDLFDRDVWVITEAGRSA